MAATGELKERIQLLQAAKARAEALGKKLKPEAQAELDSYAGQGLLGASGSGGAGKPATREGEDKANAFLIRALGANKQYEGTGVGARSLIGQGIADRAPNLLNVLPGFVGNSDERQVADTSQDEFIAASLRQDSGAAIPEEEMERQRRIYFPMPGDGEKVIEAKRQARQRALEGLVASAGRAVSPDLAARYPEYFPQQQKGGDPASTVAGAADGSGAPPSGGGEGGGPGRVVLGDELPAVAANSYRFTAEQQAALQALAQSGASADALKGLAQQFGGALTDENAQGLATFYAKPENRGVKASFDYSEVDRIKPVDPGDGAAGAAVRGVANVGSVGLVNRLGAASDAVFGGEQYDDAFARRQGYDAFDEENHPYARILGQVFGGAAIPTTALGASRAAGIAAVRAGLPVAEARNVANIAFARRTAMEAGGFSGAYGFNDAQGGFSERLATGLASAGLGVATGGALAYGGGRAAIALRNRGAAAAQAAPVASDAQLFGEAAARRGVDYLPADVPGATAARMASGLTNVSLGAIPLSEAAGRAIGSAERAKGAVARGIGTIGDPTQAGQAVQRGAKSFITATEGKGQSLYEAIPIAAKTDADVTSTRATLNNLTAGLESNPRLSRLLEDPKLKAYADALSPNENVVGPLPRRGVAPAFLGEDGKVYAGRVGEQHFSAASPELREVGVKGIGFVDSDGRFLDRQQALAYVNQTGENIKPSSNMAGELDALDYREQSRFARDEPAVPGGQLSWQDLKSFRTYVGEKLGGQQLQSDTSRNALKALYASLSADMEATAAAQGPRALNAFKRANRYWRGRQQRIENVLSDVLGDDLGKSPDAAFRAVEGLASKRSGDPIKLARLVRSLPDDEANTVRATVLDRLGLANAGRQDASQQVYSPAEFMTQWSKLSDRAKSLLFNGEHRQAVDDLVRIADGMKGSSQFANTSRTSLGTNALALAGTFWLNPLLALGSAGGQLGAGKLLASQRFARWLARAPKKPNAAAQRAHVRQLGAVMRAEPAIANEVLALQQRLTDAFGAAPARLAAQEPGDRAGIADRQQRQDGGRQRQVQP